MLTIRKEYCLEVSEESIYGTAEKRIRIRLDEDSITHFKAIFQEVGMPYQSLINLCLRNCAASRRKLNLNWK